MSIAAVMDKARGDSVLCACDTMAKAAQRITSNNARTVNFNMISPHLCCEVYRSSEMDVCHLNDMTHGPTSKVTKHLAIPLARDHRLVEVRLSLRLQSFLLLVYCLTYSLSLLVCIHLQQ